MYWLLLVSVVICWLMCVIVLGWMVICRYWMCSVVCMLYNRI